MILKIFDFSTKNLESYISMFEAIKEWKLQATYKRIFKSIHHVYSSYLINKIQFSKSVIFQQKN